MVLDFKFGDTRLPAHFWSKVKVDHESGCWLWGGSLTRGGYGQFRLGRTRRTHRIAYEVLVGPLSPRLELDHLCHTRGDDCPGGLACQHRRCCNPAHLEPVTKAENMSRCPTIFGRERGLDICKRNHPLIGDNVIQRKLGRECRACKDLKNAARFSEAARREYIELAL